MSISRKEIRDAAANARAGQIVYIDGERLTADQLGDTGKYVYTYMDHPGFTAVSALVEFIQAKAKAESFAYNYRDGQGGYVEGDAPTGGHTDGAGALAEDAAGCHYDDHPSIWGEAPRYLTSAAWRAVWAAVIDDGPLADLAGPAPSADALDGGTPRPDDRARWLVRAAEDLEVTP